MKENFVIGVLGGMGTYATIHLFQQYAEVFPAEKEWDRPRIVIDNRCTMPSRVRAFLFKENEEKLINEMKDSMQHLIDMDCKRIILACNTSHIFLPKIYEKVPDLSKYIIHIIENCVCKIEKDGLNNIFLLGSEGTIDSGIYQKTMEKHGLKCYCPQTDEYPILRDCIEAVKRNQYSEKIKQSFLNLVNRYDACILGCTELPILYERYKAYITCPKVYDPLLLGLMKLKEEYDNV